MIIIKLKNMLNKLLLLALFSIISFPVFSESYVCSYDKEQHIDTEEDGIGTVVYKRKGKEFIQTGFGWVFKIDYESKKNLLLSNITKYDPPSVMTVFINKETMVFSIDFLDLDVIQEEEMARTLGKCVVIN